MSSIGLAVPAPEHSGVDSDKPDSKIPVLSNEVSVLSSTSCQWLCDLRVLSTISNQGNRFSFLFVHRLSSSVSSLQATTLKCCSCPSLQRMISIEWSGTLTMV